jgi:hypothetical protein
MPPKAPKGELAEETRENCEADRCRFCHIATHFQACGFGRYWTWTCHICFGAETTILTITDSSRAQVSRSKAACCRRHPTDNGIYAAADRTGRVTNNQVIIAGGGIGGLAIQSSFQPTRNLTVQMAVSYLHPIEVFFEIQIVNSSV